MSKHSISILLFGCFALGLPLWAMQTNQYGGGNTHLCAGECYDNWREETGGTLVIAQQAAAARAEASPAELGQQAYLGCVACHGANGEGGIGPRLAGQSAIDIADKLLRYKNGETIGPQSSMMWSQANMLSDTDIDNIGAFVETL